MNIKKVLFTKATLFVLVLAVAASGSGGAAYIYYTRWQALRINPQQAAKEETAAIVTRVGKFMDLPAEEPTIATVTDAAGLASQPFFARAQNGDRVLVYMQALKAILYRPGTNRVIEVAPLVVNPGNPATPSATPTGMVAAP